MKFLSEFGLWTVRNVQNSMCVLYSENLGENTSFVTVLSILLKIDDTIGKIIYNSISYEYILYTALKQLDQY